MAPRRPVLVIALAVALAPCLRSETFSVETALGTRVDLEATALAPGGIVVARLAAGPGVRRVTVRLAEETIELGPAGGGAGPLGIIGLDLGLKPGPVTVSVAVLYSDGRTESGGRAVAIAPREFPEKKLTVPERYVNPPRAVQDRIRWESELLATIYGTATPRWLGEGPFGRPYEGPITANFGERRVYNKVPRSSHAGVDIAAPAGAPVRAANSGRVLLARDLYFSGRTVILDHGLGLLTVYCHFSELKVTRGESVAKGQVIGLAGSTGRSTGPHLHWSARVRQSRVDPAALVGRLDL